MKDDQQLISSGVAKQAHLSSEFADQAEKGLIDFLREQIVNAEWGIARLKAEISAYESAIEALQNREPKRHA